MKMNFKFKMIVMIILLLTFTSSMIEAKDLVASIPSIDDKTDLAGGLLTEIVKMIDTEYKDGAITFGYYPFQRSLDNVISGKADFHLPMLKDTITPASALPFNYVPIKLGDVTFVLYSHKDNPITKKMIYDAANKKGNFPYKIESSIQIKDFFPFPIILAYNPDQSLKKVEQKRIDVAIFPQEESDAVIKITKMKAIYRSYLDDYNDMIIVTKGPRGDEVNKILTEILTRMEKTGKLKEMYIKIRKPFDNWQPSKMGW